MNNEFGEYLRQKRQSKGLTIKEVSEAIGISAPFLFDVEKGNRMFSSDMSRYNLLKKVLGLTNDEFSVLMNLAGKQKGDIAPDIKEYAAERPYVSDAIRKAIELGATQEDWELFRQSLIEARQQKSSSAKKATKSVEASRD